MGILSHVFQLWEKGDWVNDLFDGWGWVGFGGTGRDWVDLTQTHFKYICMIFNIVHLLYFYM